ncbi:MAG: hypothetical protein HKM07_08530 [Chlamydiae bacterium]|nr:hypothetical protein [Chlamydiota bacterium]
MADIFTIYTDRLKDGHVEKIDTDIPPDFLGIKEENLQFSENVHIHVEAYLADDHLVLHMSAKTHATTSCTICTQPLKSLVEMKNVYHTEDLKDLRSSLYSYKEILRETLLLELHPFVECNQGNCPERTTLSGFLKKKDNEVEKSSACPTYFPFANLEEK